MQSPELDVSFPTELRSSSWIPLNTPLSGDASTRTLFVNPVKIQSAVRSYLESLEIVVRPYDDVWGFLEALGRASADSKKTVYTGEAVTWAVQRAVGEVRVPQPCENRHQLT